MTRFGVSAAACLLGACASDPVVEAPDQHSCIQRASLPEKASPLGASIDLSGLERAVIPDLQPEQILNLTLDGADGDERIEVIGPYQNLDDPGLPISSAQQAIGAWNVVPLLHGSYFIWLHDADRIKSSIIATFEVIPFPLSLCGAGQVEPSAMVTAFWTGSGGASDKLELFDPVERRVVDTVAAEGSAYDINAATLRAPDYSGVFEIRYVKAGEYPLLDLSVVVIRPDELGALRVPSLRAPGQDIELQWLGPSRPDHRFRLINSATGMEFANAHGNSWYDIARSVKIKAPDLPGEYYVEYSKGDGTPAGGRDSISVAVP